MHMSDYTNSLVRTKTGEKLREMRREYKRNGIPVILKESLNSLLLNVSLKMPKDILEIGTATGCSGIAMLEVCSGTLTTLETDSDAYLTAKNNFEEFGLTDRVTQYYGDAKEIIDSLDKQFDFIFLDGPKAHYLEYLPKLKKMLREGGVLFADNVLFRGYVDPNNEFPRRFITIVKRMRKFLSSVAEDEDFTSAVYEVGDGIMVAVKRTVKAENEGR